MVAALLLWLPLAAVAATGREEGRVVFETHRLVDKDAPITVTLAMRRDKVTSHPVILMMGAVKSGELPGWSTDLVDEGYMLAAFQAEHAPDPDPARRPQWLYFDERFANSYALNGKLVPEDASRVIDYLVARGDVNPQKIGWVGSSTTGIAGLAVCTREPRIAAIVAFVSTGAYRKWLETWHTNGLWKGGSNGLWPETEKLLQEYDPILRVNQLYPKAILMVSGGADKVVDAETAKVFYDNALPFYKADPDRLRLLVYHGCGHNLPADVVKMYVEHWFHLYMPAQKDAPAAPAPAAAGVEGSSSSKDLNESTSRTQINAAQHKDLVGAK